MCLLPYVALCALCALCEPAALRHIGVLALIIIDFSRYLFAQFRTRVQLDTPVGTPRFVDTALLNTSSLRYAHSETRLGSSGLSAA